MVKIKIMFTKEELTDTFEQPINGYLNNIEDIVFDLDMHKVGTYNPILVPRYSTFVLTTTGLLTLLITTDGSMLEYDKKIRCLEDLKIAIENIDEWKDDWNG